MDIVDYLLFNATTPKSEEQFLRYIAHKPQLIWLWNSNGVRDIRTLHEKVIEKLFAGVKPLPNDPLYNVYQEIDKRAFSQYGTRERSLVEELIRWDRNPQLLLDLHDIMIEYLRSLQYDDESIVHRLHDVFVFPNLYELLAFRTDGLKYIKVLHQIVALNIPALMKLIVSRNSLGRNRNRAYTLAYLEKIANPRAFRGDVLLELLEDFSVDDMKIKIMRYLVNIATLDELHKMAKLKDEQEYGLHTLLQDRILQLEELKLAQDAFNTLSEKENLQCGSMPTIISGRLVEESDRLYRVRKDQ